MDFRDSWTLLDDPDRKIPAWARARQRRLLHRLFRDAERVVFRYMSEAEAYWRAYPGVLKPERIHVIPNGYEGSIAQFDVPRGDRCTVLYAGTADLYSYDNVLHALKALKDSDPSLPRKLRVVFVGDTTEALARTVARLDLCDVIETTPSVPFSEANRLQREAHALLLLGWKRFPGHELGGSKIFGYFKAGRPIIGTLPRDENNRMLRSVGVRTIADIESVPEIARVFLTVLDAWATGSLPSLLPDPAACERYSAEHQTRALARVLEGLPAEEPFRPGAGMPPPSLLRPTDKEGWLPAESGEPKFGNGMIVDTKKEMTR
jgi:hypothetical protein